LFQFQAQTTCPPGCICGEHQNWETERLLLNRLKEVEVTGMRGSEHEVTFVQQLFNWATTLEKMRVVFDESVTESVAKELSQVLRSFARPEIHLKIHTYMDNLMMKMMYVPED
jgi:acid stress-induced BolA-like protein IbaG/YrbA